MAHLLSLSCSLSLSLSLLHALTLPLFPPTHSHDTTRRQHQLPAVGESRPFVHDLDYLPAPALPYVCIDIYINASKSTFCTKQHKDNNRQAIAVCACLRLSPGPSIRLCACANVCTTEYVCATEIKRKKVWAWLGLSFDPAPTHTHTFKPTHTNTHPRVSVRVLSPPPLSPTHLNLHEKRSIRGRIPQKKIGQTMSPDMEIFHQKWANALQHSRAHTLHYNLQVLQRVTIPIDLCVSIIYLLLTPQVYESNPTARRIYL